MKALIVMLLALAAATPISALAAEEDQASLPLPTRRAATSTRQESLELPGLTACHQCEWRPHPHSKAAAEQCGVAADGSPRLAEFECGFAPDCERVCNFVRCF